MRGVADYPHFPFMASLWIRSGLGWPKKGYKRLVSQTQQVGALFEALNECVLMAPLNLPCIFFTIQTILQEHCTCQLKMMVCNFPFYLYCVVQTSGQITSIFGQVL